MQPPVDLVISVTDANGAVIREAAFPLEDLPPNANAACPLRVHVSLQVRNRTLGELPLPPWGNQHFQAP